MKPLVKGCIVIFKNDETELIEEVSEDGKIKYTLLNNSSRSWYANSLASYYNGQEDEATVIPPFKTYYEEVNSGM